jgi:hypothetical protein
MMPSPPIKDRYQTYSSWLAARRTQARIPPLNSQASALEIAPHNAQRALSHQPPHFDCTLQSSLHPSRPHLVGTVSTAKSP